MVATWPDLPSRTLLLANAAVTPETAERIKKLGAEVILRPLSILGVEGVIAERLEKARAERGSVEQKRPRRTSLSGFVN
jgi:hypothetical protein